MSASKLIFIFQAKLGSKKRSQLIQYLKTWDSGFPFPWEIWDTEYAGHARSLAKQAVDSSAWGLVAVGGDGTINEIIQGMGRSKTPLGIIAMGSGNGLARSLGIPLKLSKALEVISQGFTQPMDLGLANGHPFASNAGLGFEAKVIAGFHRLPTRGFWTYLGVIISRFWTYRPQKATLSFCDGTKREVKPFFLAIANGQTWGYGFWMDASRSIRDGWLDLIMVHPFPWFEGWRLLWYSLKGTLTKSPYVESIPVQEVHIYQKGLKAFQADGDLFPAAENVHFEVVPHALMILTPRPSS